MSVESGGPVPSPKKPSYSIQWKYGERARDDYIEVTNFQKLNQNVVTNVLNVLNVPNVVKLKRWTTFKSFHFPQGAIVSGFRGRRDYKDGNCQGIMCCKWCPEKNVFMSFIFTISNGYNGTFSEKDFQTMEVVDQTEFTFYNSDAVKNIKNELK